MTTRGVSAGIAIIGMGCRFPGARDLEAFWRNLRDGVESLTVLSDAELLEAGVSPDIIADPAYVKVASVIDGIEDFDADFFGYSPREATLMDPQHRLLLETSWEAFEDAGYPVQSGIDVVGTFAGAGGIASSYLIAFAKLTSALPGATGSLGHLGNDKDFLSTRISYKLNLTGPSITVQTACSTSLVALHLACRSLRDRECNAALVASSVVRCPPKRGYHHEVGGVLSPDGHCRAFDARAEGTVWGSGVGAVILKRLEDAVADGDRIYAVVRGTAINNDGAGKVSYTASSVPSQVKAMTEAFEEAGVSPDDIGYVECHGTGTAKGDPLEVRALTRAFRGRTKRTEFCPIGSVKTNFGHLEQCAGMAGLIKVALALTNRQIPASLHFDVPNPKIDFKSSPFFVNKKLRTWESKRERRLGAINSLGFGGTNAFAVLEEAPSAELMAAAPERAAELFVLSGKNEAALNEAARRLGDHAASHLSSGFGDLAFSAATTRTHLEHRLAVSATTREALLVALEGASQGQTPAGVVRGKTSVLGGKVAFLFTGQGAQVLGMGRELHAEWSVFREAFDRCVALFDAESERSLREVMWAEAGSAEAALLDQTSYTQSALFVLEYALCALWRSWGVEPELLAGHSIGEVTAACVAGVFSVEDAVRLVAARGRLMQALPVGGAMVSIAASEAEVAAALLSHAGVVSIAAVNGPSLVVIAGAEASVQAVASSFSARGIRTKALRVSHAFHSSLMDPMLEAFGQVAESVTYRRPSMALVSSVSGRLVTDEMGAAGYWVRQVRESVRFGDAVKTLDEAGAGTFVEVGPKPTLLGLVPECLVAAETLLVASLRPGRGEVASVLEALGGLWCVGRVVTWPGVFPRGRRRVSLPAYPWQRQRYWIESAAGSQATSMVPSGLSGRWPLAGVGIRTPGASLRRVLRIGSRYQTFLGDHVVFGRVVVPGAFLVSVVLAIASDNWPDQALEVTGVEFLRAIALEAGGEVDMHVVLTPELEGPAYGFEIATEREDKSIAAAEIWTTHARGRVVVTVAQPRATPPSDARGLVEQDIDATAVYAKLAAANIEWGPLWRWLRSGRVSDSGAFADLIPTYSDAHDVAPLHPSLLDNGFATGLLSVLVRIDDGTPQLPFAVERLRWWKVPVGTVRCRATLRPQQGGAVDVSVADLVFRDETGAVVAEVEGFVSRRAPRGTFFRQEVDASTASIYRLTWRELPLLDGPAAQRGPSWIVVGASGAAAASLSERLGGCVVAEASGLGDALSRATSIAGVICMWEAGADEAPSATAQRVAVEGLSVVRTLQGQAAPRVIWVTRSAVAVHEGDAVSVGTSSAWGLGRTVMQEHPELGCTLVDLGPEEEWIEGLVHELSASDGETQVAWRAGRRYVARLMRVEARAPEVKAVLPREGSVLVTGGLGALGLHVARWLASQGVRHLVLTGRRGLATPGASEAVRELEGLGARVTVAEVDVAEREALGAVLGALPLEFPLRGVVHAAGVLDDGVLAEQTAERFARVLSPKVAGAWNLHELTAGAELDFFVMFSSVSGLLGAAGQSNYAAANTFLDALAAHRRASGLPAHSLAWGPWLEGGMAAGLGAAQQARLARQGMKALSSVEGIALFEQALSRSEAQLGVVRLDLQAIGRAFSATVPPVWRALVRAPVMRAATGVKEGLASRLATLPASRRAEEVLLAVRGDVARVLGLGTADAVPVDRPLSELGLDSLMAVELRNALGQHVGKTLPATLAFDYPTVDALTRWLLDDVLVVTEPAAPLTKVSKAIALHEPIAIVGLGCRFPGGVTDPESFWRLLDDGVDGISEVPSARWDIDALYDPDPDAPGKMMTRWGGFVSDVDRFDPAFFGISPREATMMDPQQRLLLETSWEALEAAGMPPDRLMGSDTGVFVGLMYQEYASLGGGGLEALDGYVSTGNAASIASGRISYVLGLKGPSLTVDTACSSSLVTVHLACQALRQDECSLALAGGVSLMLTPASFVEFSRLRGLAADGRCKSFSASADGVAWSEGCGMVVLKRLSDAQRDGDPILAVIRGSAVNQDGRSQGMTAPNGPSQQAVIRRALEQAGVSPSEVDYVECHGTGTTLGDPIEVQALGAVLSTGRAPERPVVIGSSKSNVGHTQAAAGAAGIMKVVLSLQHDRIPKNLHFDAPSPHIPWSELPVKVAHEAMAWPRNGVPRRAGVSSFGYSGTNAHVVLEEAPTAEPVASSPERGAELFVVSAKNDAALHESAMRLRDHLVAHPELGLGDVAFSLATTRSAMEHRLAVSATTREALLVALEGASQGQTPAGVVRNRALSSVPKVVFVFPGQGSQWLGMGRQLLEEEPVFRAELEACDRAIQAEAGWSLLSELRAEESSSQLHRIDVVQPSLFAMAVGLSALWRSWGVEPAAVVGHSMGEVAAAYVAGALSLEDAVAIMCRRSRLLLRIGGQGEMAVVELSLKEAEAALAGYEQRLSVAVSNSPRSTVLSGEPLALGEVLSLLEAKGVFCRRVKVDVASHSPQVDPLREDLVAALSGLKPQRVTIPMRSTVTRTMVTGLELEAGYWADNLRQPVHFSEAVHALMDEGHGLFIEMSPHPILSTSVEEIRQTGEREGVALGSLRRGQAERFTLLESLGVLWTRGYPMAWDRLHLKGGARVPLPTYPWQRERYWIEMPSDGGVRRSGETTGHPLLGIRVPAAGRGAVFEATVGLSTHPWLGDHRVVGQVLVPGAAMAEVMLAAAVHGVDSFTRLTDLVLQAPLALSQTGARRTQVVLARDDGEAATVAFYSQSIDSGPGARWTLHATANISDGATATKGQLNLSALRARCKDALDVNDMYSQLADVGTEYGPAFRGVQSLWRGAGESLAEVALPSVVDIDSYILHPALLDAAFHTITAALFAKEKWTLVLPFSMGGFAIHQPAATAAWVHARIRSADGPSISADVTLADASGVVLAEVNELLLQRADLEAIKRGRAEVPEDVFYRLAWRELPLLDGPAAQRGPSWIVVGASGAAAASLSERLGGCVVAEASGLGDALSRATSIAGVICMWEAGADEAPSATAQRVAVEGLSVVRTLQGQAAPRVIWVTRSAVAVHEGDAVSVGTSSAWGLGRTVMQEHPELGCTLVDLGPEEEWIEGLVHELSASDGETQVAWRAGRRYVARLMRVEARAPEVKAVLPREGSVLVTGGLGALGLHVARWLASQGVRHLVMTGRRGLATPGASEAVRELEALGARVTVAEVDVAEREALGAVLGALPLEFPLRGVVHAAGVLDDGVLAEQTAERFARVLSPKVAGAWNLHELTAGAELDFFVMFSSVSGLLGAAGQSNYAAANTFLDALAAHRRASGLPAHSLAWGAWSEVGLAASLDAKKRVRLARQGIRWISPTEGIALFERALARPEALLGVMPLDLGAIGRGFGSTVPSIWRALVTGRATASVGARGAWASRLATLPASRRAEEVLLAVRGDVARVLGLGTADAVPVDRPLSELGLDSLTAVELRNTLGQRVGKTLSATLAFNYPTVNALTRWLLEEVLLSTQFAPATPSVAPLRAENEPIAIVGIGCRYPGGVIDPDSFWQLLDSGADAIDYVPRSRWDVNALYDPDPDAPGKMTTRSGGFVPNIDRFDPAFFSISPREAVKLDPQQRLVLETSWEALERAGILPAQLMGSDAGVFVGLMSQEYGALAGSLEACDGYFGTGTAGSVASGRLSYQLGLTGPSLTVDTACSSSLVAVHLASQALRQGECSVAFAGGVTLMLTPTLFVEFSRLRGMASDGRCKSFSADADGAGWGEGCGMLVLKRLSDAQRDGDPILAVIRGSAVNQDGRSQGMTAPNGLSQAALIRSALTQAGVAPAQVSYVEGHGTGTSLGDPIEVQALGVALAEGRAPEQPVILGSVKSNIGHTQAAAGVAGLIKTILSLEHARIPKSLHVGALSPHIPWAELPVVVAAEAVDWPRSDKPRFAGVSSFGISGTNAHVVLEEAPAAEAVASSPERGAELFVVSAKNDAALHECAMRLRDHLVAHPELGLGDVAFSLATTRSAMEHRLAVSATTREALLVALEGASQGQTPAGVVRGKTSVLGGKVAFLFTGQGAQVLGMGRELHAEWSVFREAFDRCVALFDAESERSLREVMWAEAGSAEAALLDQTSYTQSALFVLEYALCALWRSWGVEPELLAGHSIGEVTAACVAGVFSVEDAVRLVAARGRLMQALPVGGAMVSIAASEAEVAAALLSHAGVVSIAAVNGPSLVVIAGAEASVQAVASSFSARGIRTKALRVSHAFHSSLMDPMLEAFGQVAESVTYRRPSMALVSSVSGRLVTDEMGAAGYWARQVRESVRFGDAVKTLDEAGAGTFVEVGPKPTLLGLVPSCVPNANSMLLTSLRAERNEAACMLEALGGLWNVGRAVAWSGVFPRGRRVSLPTYPWQRERYWIEERDQTSAGSAYTHVDQLYQLDWPEVPRVVEERRDGSGNWLILTDRGGSGEAVAKLLAARGFSCTMARRSTQPLETDAQVAQLLAAQTEWRGVVYLWGLDAVVEETASSGEVGEAAQRATWPAAALVKALAAGMRSTRLSIVTRGACAVDSETTIAPCQAALWGLGRVVALEHPALWGGLIDLDPEGSTSEFSSLVEELLSPGADDQLAFRGGRRHAARLTSAHHEPPGGASTLLCAEGSYLVTGGLGAIGLLVARRLAERGARHLVLTSRHGLPERADWGREQPADVRECITAVEALEALGARVTAAAVDAADAKAMEDLIAVIEPIRGIVHAAGVLDDGLLVHLDAKRLSFVMRPKVEGAWVLHTLTRNQPLEFFVLFSSAASVLGAIGQGSYAAGNAFLDALAEARRVQGRPALSIGWGLWADGAMGTVQQRRAIEESGMRAMPTAVALPAMDWLMGGSVARRLVMSADWARLKSARRGVDRGRLLDRLVNAAEVTRSMAASRARSWRGQSLAEVRPALLALVRGTVARVLGFEDAGALDAERGFTEQGLDSLMAVQIRSFLQAELGAPLPVTLAFDYPTVDRLVAHLLAEVLEVEDRASLRDPQRGIADEPIAIVGAACRFPGGADGLEEYWHLLASGVVASMEVPVSRWRMAGGNPDELSEHKFVTRGGFLSDVETFDPAFFRISPREALSLDPQQRLLLEVSWEALEHAGQAPATLQDRRTGVFVGAGPNEYAERLSGISDDAVGLYGGTGNMFSVAAGRLSFFLGLQGPSMAVDTACSSSLVALHLGCQSLRLGECGQALVGAVNVLVSPRSFASLTRMGALAPDGRCKTFSAEADGYARAEGCGVLVLKRLRDAQRDGDSILAVIRSTAVNHDGASSGLTVPNGPAQQAVLRQALAQSGLAPSEVDYVECHGTGTALGDPIEVQALSAVYGEGRPAERPVVLGAAKSSIGHLEAAAGMAGVLKVVLSLRHGVIPGQAGLGALSPHIPWSELPVKVAHEAMAWPRNGVPRRAGVSSFGMSGTNAHVVLEEAPAAEAVASSPERGAELFVVSAKSDAALHECAMRLRDHLVAHPELGLGDVAFSLATTRSAMEHRLAVSATTREALLVALEGASQGQTPAGVVRNRALSSVPKVVFVFPGQGSQWLGMGRQLLEEEPVFRAELEACDRAIQAEAGWSLLSELRAEESSSQLHRIDVVQPSLFAMAVGLSALWRSWGVEPAAVVGHSMGEVAAAYVAGALSLEDAVAIMCRRSRLLLRIGGQGEMAVVELSLKEAEAALAGYEQRLSVAVSNSPRSTVLSGEPLALGEVLSLLEAKGVFCRRVKVDVASHSPQVDPLREDLVAALSGVKPQRVTIPMRSTVTRTMVTGLELEAGYWADNLRQPVHFSEAVHALMDEGHGLFIEMSPHPILSTSVEEIRQAGEREGVGLGSLRRGQAERFTLLESLGALWTRGYPMAWDRLHLKGGARVPLPTYPWQRERYWIEMPSDGGVRGSLRVHGGSHPLLGEAQTLSTQAGTRLWETTLDVRRLPWLSDHRVQGAVVLPGAAYVEVGLACGAEVFGETPFAVTDVVLVEALAFAGDAAVAVQVVATEEQAGLVRFQVASRNTAAAGRANWRVHARGMLRRTERGNESVTLDVAGLRARLSAPSMAEKTYAELNEIGLEYGPAFQGLMELQGGEGEALGQVHLPEAAGSASAYAVHPAVLDACFQAMAGALTGSGGTTPWVPVEIGSVQVFRRPSGELWCHAQIAREGEPGPGRQQVDLRIVDKTGASVVEIRKLVVQRLASGEGRREEDDWFLELSWESMAVPKSTAMGLGRWLVLGAGGGLGTRVRSSLEARGHAVVHVTDGLNDVDMKVLVEKAFGGQAPTAVVHLGSLEEDGGVGVESVEGALERGCDSVLATVQALCSKGYRDAPRLWLVTRGAQAVGGNEIAVAQSPLLGLGRVIAMEHAELRCGRLDLDPSRPDSEVEAVLAELLADDTEEEIALRGGERRVARLARPRIEKRRERVEMARGRSFRLEMDAPGVLDHLTLRGMERREPRAGEVEIEVEAAGLNFLDVLLALGVMPNDVAGKDKALLFGGECAGRIVAVGEGVKGLAVGQGVIALAGGTFASHVTTSSELVLPRPSALSATEAAALPVAYLTAWYALDRVARLERGERVLIHAATGGVGLAAVQWAQHVGAEVYATAGSPEKRAYLESLGVKYVSDSRTDRFVSDVRTWTGGEGVDVVLNSLSGELIEKSFMLLRSHGRFVELGKRDYYANNQLGLQPFLRNLSFSLVDLRGMIVERAERVRRLFEELLALVDAGVFTPPPIARMPMGQAADAFRKMAQAQHLGKLVLTLADPEVPIHIPAESHEAIRADGSYLVTGGLGGLGLSVAGWLAKKGAGHLVLVGRTGVINEQQRAAVAAMQAHGARVTVAKADVADRAQMAGVIDDIAASGIPLSGVVHAAGVLDDGLLMQQTPERFRTVMGPKILGALHLHALTLDAPLSFFVMYSSGAGLLGSPGQGNYAAANTFLDALAHHRRTTGLPGLSIDWGAFSDVGLAVAQSNRGARLDSRGMRSLTPAEGLTVLERLLDSDHAQVGVMPINLRQWAGFYQTAAASPLFSRLMAEQRAGAARSTGDKDLLARLAAADPDERMALLQTMLRTQVSQVLRIPENKFEMDAPFTSLGMDSLMGLELRNRIEAALGINMPATLLWTYPNVDALKGHLSGHASFAWNGEVAHSREARDVVTEVVPLDDNGLFALLDEELALAAKRVR